MKQERRLAQAGLREIEASVKVVMEATAAAKDMAEAGRQLERGTEENGGDPEEGGEEDGAKGGYEAEGDGSGGGEGAENQDPEGGDANGVTKGEEAGVPKHGGKPAKRAVGRPSKSRKSSEGSGKAAAAGGKKGRTPTRTYKIESFFGKQQQQQGTMAADGEDME